MGCIRIQRKELFHIRTQNKRISLLSNKRKEPPIWNRKCAAIYQSIVWLIDICQKGKKVKIINNKCLIKLLKVILLLRSQLNSLISIIC